MADPVITTTYEADDDGYNEVETPDIPVPVVKRHNIRELRELKQQYKAAWNHAKEKAAEWKAKLDEVQLLIDKYNELRG